MCSKVGAGCGPVGTAYTPVNVIKCGLIMVGNIHMLIVFMEYLPLTLRLILPLYVMNM